MRRQALFLCIFLFSNISIFSQIKVDEFISVEIPGNVQKMDTVIENVSALSYYSNSKTESFVAFRMKIISKEQDLPNLPENLSGLRSNYHEMMVKQVNSMSRKGFVLKDTQEIKIKNYFAYKIIYKTADSPNIGAETILLNLNGVDYFFTYSRIDEFVEKNKESFFNSIAISNSSKQIMKKEESKSIFFLLLKFGFYGVILVLFIGFMRKENHNNSKWGINLKTIYCPVCKTEQKRVRIPKNIRQLFWGGCTCPNCGTEMDKFGGVIKQTN
jgi:hypothetical protein